MKFCSLTELEKFCSLFDIKQKCSAPCCIPWRLCKHPIDYQVKRRWCILFDYIWFNEEQAEDLALEAALNPNAYPYFRFSEEGLKYYAEIKFVFLNSRLSLSAFRDLADVTLKVK